MTQTRTVKDLMSTDIMTVPDDMTIDDVARYLIEHEISGTPVVDEQGHLVGVVSMTDIGRNVAEPPEVGSSGRAGFDRDDEAEFTLEDLGQKYIEERAATARDVMTPAVHQIPVTASVKLALATYERKAQEYGARARAAEQMDGSDWKSLYHAVRVAHEAMELMATGKLTFPRPEKDLLLEIRLGKLPLEAVQDMIEENLERVEKAVLVSSLPEKPDYAFADNLVEVFYRGAVLQP